MNMREAFEAKRAEIARRVLAAAKEAAALEAEEREIMDRVAILVLREQAEAVLS